MVTFTRTTNDLLSEIKDLNSQNVIWVKKVEFLNNKSLIDDFYSIPQNTIIKVEGILNETQISLSGLYVGNLTLLMGLRNFYLLPYKMINQPVIPVIDSPLFFNGQSYEPLFKIGNTLSTYKGLFLDPSHPIKLKGFTQSLRKSELAKYGFTLSHFTTFGKIHEVEFSKVKWISIHKIFETCLIAEYEFNSNKYYVIFEE